MITWRSDWRRCGYTSDAGRDAGAGLSLRHEQAEGAPVLGTRTRGSVVHGVQSATPSDGAQKRAGRDHSAAGPQGFAELGRIRRALTTTPSAPRPSWKLRGSSPGSNRSARSGSCGATKSTRRGPACWRPTTCAQRKDNLVAIFNTDSLGGKSQQDIDAGVKTNATLYTVDEGKPLADLMTEVNESYAHRACARPS